MKCIIYKKKKYFSLLPGIDQTRYKVEISMVKEVSTKIVNFIASGAGALMPGHGHVSHYSEYASSSTL